MKNVTVNLKKMVVLLALSGTMALTLAGCEEKKESTTSKKIDLSFVTKEPDTKETLNFSFPTPAPTEAPKEEVIPTEEVTPTQEIIEDAVESWEEYYAESGINPIKKTDAMVLYHDQDASFNRNEVSVFCKGNSEKGLQDEDYQAINQELANTKDVVLDLLGFSLEKIDFSKFDATNVKKLSVRFSKGKMNLENISGWGDLTALRLTGTDFENLQSLTRLEEIQISKPSPSNDFAFSTPISNILEDLKNMNLKSLFLGGFPVSYVPFHIESLAIDYQDSEVPNALVCDAERIGIYSTSEEKQEMPLVVNQNSGKSLAVEGFKIEPIQKTHFSEWENVTLGGCDFSFSVEEMADCQNARVYQAKFANSVSCTYFNSKEDDTTIWYQKDKTGKEKEVFRVSQEEVKTNIKN